MSSSEEILKSQAVLALYRTITRLLPSPILIGSYGRILDFLKLTLWSPKLLFNFISACFSRDSQQAQGRSSLLLRIWKCSRLLSLFRENYPEAVHPNYRLLKRDSLLLLLASLFIIINKNRFSDSMNTPPSKQCDSPRKTTHLSLFFRKLSLMFLSN